MSCCTCTIAGGGANMPRGDGGPGAHAVASHSDRRAAGCARQVRRRRRSASTAAAATTPSFPVPPATRRSAPRAASASALPRLELFLSAHRGGAGHLLAEKSRAAARSRTQCCMSGVRGAGVIEPRRGPANFRSTGSAAIIAISIRARPIRRKLQGGVRGREHAAAPGPMRGPVTSAHRRAAILKDKITRPRQKPCCISGVR